MFSPLCIKGSHQANVVFVFSMSIVKTRYMRSVNYFYLEECLISKHVKLTGLDEMIRIDIHYITRFLSVHACMSVRPTVRLISISYASFLSCYYIDILI